MSTAPDPLPPISAETASIASMLGADGRFARFMQAAGEEGMADMLEGDGPFTLFVPPDSVIADAATVDAAGYIAAGRLEQADLSGIAGRLSMLDGTLMPVHGGDALSVGQGSRILQADIVATNGIIHVIDAPLAP